MTAATHVLGASVGRPAAGVAVALPAPDPAGGRVPAEPGETGGDGRHRCGAATAAGVDRLVPGAGSYAAARGAAAFCPEVRGAAAFCPEVTVTDTDGGGHYHVPLPLPPFACSAYRRSQRGS